MKQILLNQKIVQIKRLKKKLKERVEWRENWEGEMEKPSWFELNRKEFEELAREIYNNQDNNNFKIIIKKRTYDLKKTKKN